MSKILFSTTWSNIRNLQYSYTVPHRLQPSLSQSRTGDCYFFQTQTIDMSTVSGLHHNETIQFNVLSVRFHQFILDIVFNFLELNLPVKRYWSTKESISLSKLDHITLDISLARDWWSLEYNFTQCPKMWPAISIPHGGTESCIKNTFFYNGLF